MRLVQDGSLPDHVEIAIVNGYFTHHPFQHSSGQFQQFIHVFEDIRALPQDSYRVCLDAVRTLVQKMHDCNGCHSKGLIYLKLLATGLDEDVRRDAEEEYNRRFKHSRYHRYRDYEVDVVRMMLRAGVAVELLQELYPEGVWCEDE